jgi:hypothetical protein
VTPNCSDIKLIGPWVWERMGTGLWYEHGKSCMGVVDAEFNPKWGVVYDDYEVGGSIKMHVAIDDPKFVSRRAIQAVFEYPFHDLRVKKVLATVCSENVKALSMDMRLGFKLEAIIEDAYDRGDMYILSMTQEQCRWLRGIEDGNRKQRATYARY